MAKKFNINDPYLETGFWGADLGTTIGANIPLNKNSNLDINSWSPIGQGSSIPNSWLGAQINKDINPYLSLNAGINYSLSSPKESYPIFGLNYKFAKGTDSISGKRIIQIEGKEDIGEIHTDKYFNIKSIGNRPHSEGGNEVITEDGDVIFPTQNNQKEYYDILNLIKNSKKGDSDSTYLLNKIKNSLPSDDEHKAEDGKNVNNNMDNSFNISAAQFLPPVLQTGYGIYQAIRGNQLATQYQRPTYTIPPEISQNLSDAQRMALQGMPEQQRQNYINDIQRSGQTALNAMGSRKAGLTGLGVVNQNQNDAYNHLLGMDAQQRMQNQQQLLGVRQNVADFRNQSFDLNQMQPYVNNFAQSQAMQNAGNQNIYGGASSATNLLGQAANAASSLAPLLALIP